MLGPFGQCEHLVGAVIRFRMFGAHDVDGPQPTQDRDQIFGPAHSLAQLARSLERNPSLGVRRSLGPH